MRGALDDAGIAPSAVDLWLTSRDGVVEMDRAEEEAGRRLFGASPPRTLSVKDAIGEMAAAGAAQLVAAAHAIAAGTARAALIDSFGAGGNFLAAVMESAA